LGIGLATAGTCLMILKINKKLMLLLGTGLMFSFLYLWRVQANPHHIYVMRRYVPVVMPLAIVASAYFIGWLLNQRKILYPVVGSILSILWLLGLGWSARGFITQVDYINIIPQIEELNEQLAPQSILLFNDQTAITMGDFVGTPMRFLYGHDVFSLRDPSALHKDVFNSLIDTWQGKGRQVYWIGDRTLLNELGLKNKDSFKYIVETQHLEGTFERKPSQVDQFEWILDVAIIE
jgi:hypothetical protein